jgi:hypothetical protein
MVKIAAFLVILPLKCAENCGTMLIDNYGNIRGGILL